MGKEPKTTLNASTASDVSDTLPTAGEVERKIRLLCKLYEGKANTNGAALQAEAIDLLEDTRRDDLNLMIRHLGKDHRTIVADIESFIVFDDLDQLNNPTLTRLLEPFEPQTLGLALKWAEPSLREKMLVALPSHKRPAVEAMMDGPPRTKKEVKAALIQIMTRARLFQEKGLVSFTVSAKDIFV